MEHSDALRLCHALQLDNSESLLTVIMDSCGSLCLMYCMFHVSPLWLDGQFLLVNYHRSWFRLSFKASLEVLYKTGRVC